ncbi:hypothetical protein PQ455_10420 [Sphingomonas naphthae]|uniref:DUF2190 family protein n=1 Tax=Sphingomonas naphthae TaxID=1813468 RepID=A0ABY7TFP6_9SPHN|nr:hypothetical protein [Sphingomonas naphthae]WCT72062.1 hypothetical protein PQ455_10420 [Sphingomonas naphthae]
MTALTAARNTPAMMPGASSHPVKGATTLFAGALACLSATGFAIPGTPALNLIAVGRVKKTVVNAGADGDVRAEIESGVFRWANSASADAITRAEIGDDCYVVDDQTVAKTDGSGARSKAGRIVQVDAQGVWVRSTL